MAWGAYGQLFIGDTAPDGDPVREGSLWVDVSVAENPALKVCIDTSPSYVWVRTQETVYSFVADLSAGTWTNQPAGATDFRGFTHVKRPVYLAGMTQAQLRRFIDTGGAGFAGSDIYVEYNTDLTGAGGSWDSLAASGAVDVTIDAAGGAFGSWVTIASGAKATAGVLLRLRGKDGNATVDPIFGPVDLAVR